MVAIVRRFLDKNQIVGSGYLDTPPVQPQPPTPCWFDPGGALVLGPQIVSCNNKEKIRELSNQMTVFLYWWMKRK